MNKFLSIRIGVLAVALGFAAFAAHDAHAAFSFTATPSVVQSGGTVHLSWSAPDQNCTTNNFGQPSGFDGGDVWVNPTTNTTYTMRCANVTQSVTVTITSDTQPSLSVFSANPSTVVSGNSSVISWASNGATSCSASGFDTGGATSGSVSVAPNVTTTYYINCSNPTYSTGNQPLTINVTQPVFDASCSPNRSTALIGQNVVWNASAWNGTAPYTYSWLGQIIEGFTGSSATAAYESVGTKTSSVKVTDSSQGTSAMAVNTQRDRICTGSIIASNVGGSIEDGGEQSDMENVALEYAAGVFYGGEGVQYNQSYRSTFDAVVANPQNYCVDTKLTQQCNPHNNIAWEGCNFQFRVNIHSGNGTRATNSGDFGSYVPDGQGPQWDQNRFYGVATGAISQSAPRTIIRSCNASVAVSANAPTASLTANPVSITQGSNSTLTWSSTNATSCTGTNFSTGNATSGSLVVTPASTTNYSVSCTGPGGTATSAVTVSVTLLYPNLNATLGPAVSTTVGVPTTFTGTTANTGAAIAPAGFYDLFTFFNSDLTAWDGYVNTPTSGAIAASGSAARSVSYTFSNPGTYYYRLCADWAGTVAESNEGDNCSSLSQITVSAAPVLLADLTAGSVSPSTATAGQSTSFSAPVTNIGNASSGAFPTVFQVANASITATLAMVQSSYISLTPNESYTISVPYTFGSSGTYNIRACANNNSSWVNITSESNYGNNCGPWTVVTVSSPAPTGSLSCTASSATASTGQSVTYTVTPQSGATGPYTWDDHQGGSYGTASTITRTFSTNGSFAMDVSGSNTVSASYACRASGDSDNLIEVGCAAPHTATIDASRTRVNQGEGVTLTYQAQGINSSCVIAGPAGTISTIPASTCVVPSGSVPSGAIQTQSRFTITCDGSVADDVVVNVIPKFQEF